MTSHVHLENISKAFSGIQVLRDINLSIAEGEFVAIVGYSGSGKTTLVNMIAGLLRPDAGSVRVGGKPVEGPGPDRGLVFQNYSLLPWLTVYENVGLAVEQVFPNLTASERRAHTEKYIAMVNLTPAQDKRPSELSGGMRQRVSVARALSAEPSILLLDEPLGALDALTRATLQDEILRIWETDRRTVLLITNDVDEGILMADRIIPLTTGPGATLGPEFVVDIPRPRDRAAVNHDPRFKDLRNAITAFLLQSATTTKARVQVKLRLPDLLPEDLSQPRPLFSKPRPRRRGEERKELLEVEP